MERGDLVTQAELFNALDSVTVLPVTSPLIEAPLLRIPVQPDAGNGLQRASRVMVDKVMTVKRDKLGSASGHLAADTLVEVERCLTAFLGIAK